MHIKIVDETPPFGILKLLSYATSMEKVNEVYRQYFQLSNHHLFASVDDNNQIIGCIGVELQKFVCEIKHIAVMPDNRSRTIGSHMITYVSEQFNISHIIAETDKDAVNFYKKYGFTVTSLGEKYAGVERFLCEYKLNDF